MRFQYDSAVDALTLVLRERRSRARPADVTTREVAPSVYLDSDSRGLLAIEVLDASRLIPRSELEAMPGAARHLTLLEASEVSGLAASTLRVQIRNGRLAAIKRGRDWLVTEAALLTYLESRKRQVRQPVAPNATRARRGAAIAG